MNDTLTPKIIHYCWFGRGQFDEKMRGCIASWEKLCPDYKIMRWDEDSFDLDACLYVRQAYEKKRYAFVTDYVRFKVLKEYGGFYLDTDVELIKSPDDFLDNEATLSFKQKVGAMTMYGLTSAVIGCKRGSTLFDPLISQFESRSYLNEKGEEDMTPVAKFLTDLLVEGGFAQDNTLQGHDGIAVYPNDYLCPTLATDGSGTVEVTPNTHAIHYFSGTWRTPEILEMIMEKIKHAKQGENVV